MTTRQSTFATIALVLFAGLVHGDALPPRAEATISGPEASKIAKLMVVSSTQEVTYAEGNAKITCVKKAADADFTCVVKVLK